MESNQGNPSMVLSLNNSPFWERFDELGKPLAGCTGFDFT